MIECARHRPYEYLFTEDEFSPHRSISPGFLFPSLSGSHTRCGAVFPGVFLVDFYLTQFTSGYESWKGERGSTLPRIYNFQEPHATSGAACSDNQCLIPILHIKFPPFSTKSVHPSANLPILWGCCCLHWRGNSTCTPRGCSSSSHG